ncbi:hypothetical protein [Catenuloplanes indicus]|uniref:Uncharacterized protein n=1 Tax=Catenuloplanes indicus TaxID=137267 RepID=A0AAE3W812_9ACTN|nr:hypothetical protein [Catenuloplanes indicus]MDQ0371229.1 hypothetical protein [Catenuloplanes indicus]
MSKTDAAVAADLALAGLEFLERIMEKLRGPLPPLRGAASCLPEHGRFDSDPVDVDAPDMPARVNEDWWRMATEFGLFDAGGEFLVGVDYRDPGAVDGEYGWARVRLARTWDLAAGGSEALRGYFGAHFTDRYVPEFAMISLDQRVLLNTTIWGNGTVSTIVIRPDRL